MTVRIPTLAGALDLALHQLECTLAQLGPDTFPGDTSVAQHYQPRRLDGAPAGANVGWTTGFWTSQLWLGWSLGGRAALRAAAERQTASFIERLRDGVDLEHHDLGFLYILSCAAAHYLTGDQAAHQATLGAGKRLLSRFLPHAGVIQSWGSMDSQEQRGRVIIDGIMNLPLLHYAARASGNPAYTEAARSHLQRTREHLVRPGGATYHTYHFDPASGVALRPSTHQGLSDDSCWARGQAWGLYGFAINHRYLPEMGLLDDAMRLADYFLDQLPPDRIALWDLSLQHDSGEPRDSSACAIAACGLLEIAAQLPAGATRSRYYEAAQDLVQAMITHCAGARPESGGLLRHSVYHRAASLGVDEATLWGDYYYLEALARLQGRWTPSQ
ncbi:glycoside hydrolase family 88 protein [Massilia terrae]|uniref:Glycoside hydrolase family 88 protein n=1 Tax=Massilia terrae TaxID=1811224 RepID=A0ABT2CT43_9BURK|nr:glycoside hydrolase family 88 protein [Massilia terrae]MCS0657147.1 glycoside hydrolase family 88 protein [Massilia terrae]